MLLLKLSLESKLDASLTFRAYGGVEVDVWSTGVILFAMLSGKKLRDNKIGTLPFDDESIGDLFAKIKEARFFMPNFICEEAKDLVNRML